MKDRLTPIERKMDVGTPCRVCGGLIREEDWEALVFVGYSARNESRAAHGACFDHWPDRGEWAYPVDDPGPPGPVHP